MEFNIGDKLEYKSGNGRYLTAEVVDIWKNSSERITGYFAVLGSGEFVHILPDSDRWCKVEESVLIT